MEQDVNLYMRVEVLIKSEEIAKHSLLSISLVSIKLD